MSKIEFTKISAKNFNSFEEFNLEIKPGKHLIMGSNLSSGSSTSNGTGKSSLVESIPYTLYKKSPRGNDVSRDYKGNCMTAVEFIKDGARYKAERYYKDKLRKNELLLYQDDEDMSARLKGTNEDELKKLIHMPYDLFTSSVVVLQGMPANFSLLTPTYRKQQVEEFIGFQVWDKYKEIFSGCYKESDLNKKQKEMEFSEIRLKMTSLNTQLETLKSSKKEVQEDISKQTEELNSKITSLETEIDSTTKSYMDLNQNLQQRGGSNIVYSSLLNTQNRLSNLIRIVDEKICPTCTQNYPPEKIKEATEEAEFLRGKVNSLKSSYEEIKKMESDLNSINIRYNGLVQEKNIYSDQLSNLKTRSLQQEIAHDFAGMEHQLKDYLLSINGLNSEIAELKTEMDHLSYLNEQMMPSSKFRTYVLEKYMGYINSIIESITPLIFEDINLQLVIDSKATGIELEITRNGSVIDYKSMSGGEKKRLDIIIILAFQRFQIESSGVSTNLIVLDEIFDALDQRGIQNVLNCLESLYPDDTAIYVISHNDSLKSSFSSVVKVIKENGISRIEYTT